ncbi:hypothetical protein [Corynebacterium caspium]|uniref:hypothetical protein n=1 Tax=Corynebacterium caspium TaxID=234828 RepID=UPI000381B67B|nr:hypothetical protein [Corynebacterium caspium]
MDPVKSWLQQLVVPLRNSRGMVTVEAAIALGSLVTVGALLISGIGIMATTIAVTDAAGAAARSLAIGVDYHPPAHIQITQSQAGDFLKVEATAPVVIIGKVSASAYFPKENAYANGQ